MLKLLSLRLCVIEIIYISRPLSFLSSNLSTSFHRMILSPEDECLLPPGNHRRRRGIGSRRHTGQQDNQSEVAVPSEMERLWSGAQLMETSGKRSRTRHYRGLLSETPRSHKTHPVSRIFFPPFPTHHHAEMSRF